LPLGDTWRHAAIRRADPTNGLVGARGYPRH
jgi:hypothetical protein